MNKSESKYYNTACLMDEALIKLIEKKDYNYITVKEVCVKAGVNRSTFYLHYETMDDLLRESVEWLAKNLWSYFNVEKPDIKNMSLDSLFFINKEYLTPYLTFIKDHKTIMQIAIKKPWILDTDRQFKKIYSDILLPILTKYGLSEQRAKYTLAFFIDGIMALIYKWTENDCKEDISYIADLIESLIPHPNDTKK